MKSGKEGCRTVKRVEGSAKGSSANGSINARALFAAVCPLLAPSTESALTNVANLASVSKIHFNSNTKLSNIA